jgi:hypothetical protein
MRRTGSKLLLGGGLERNVFSTHELGDDRRGILV